MFTAVPEETMSELETTHEKFHMKFGGNFGDFEKKLKGLIATDYNAVDKIDVVH